MEIVWYALNALMLTAYVVLDGFDLGAGIIHLFVARTDDERQQVFAAIGPYWNGNEVWLVAAGGLLVFSFPRVYAVGFSGFYLPLVMVLWCLLLRGLSIEFRSKEPNQLWRAFWDAVFSVSSVLLAIVLGAALGNIIRGVPITAAGFFDGPLFTDFQPGVHSGVLDWYTVSIGVFAAVVLAMHGALYLVWKTTEAVRDRARKVAKNLLPVVVVAGCIVTVFTQHIRPELYASLVARPWTWVLAAGILISCLCLVDSIVKQRELYAFLSSVGCVTCLLVATAAGMFPNMLISTIDARYSITAMNSATGASSLGIGLTWWIPTVVLAILYFVNLFRTFKGKVDTSAGGYGH